MSADPVRKIADAVLYEGYVLWPYTRSTLKNQQRFTFGGIYPRGWPDDRCAMHTECLLECDGEPDVELRVRFLHVVRRQMLDAAGRPVDALEADGERHLTWDEAAERELDAPGPFTIPAGRDAEPLGDGCVLRSWEELRGRVELSSTRVREGLHRISVRVANEAEWAGETRERTLMRTFCSTHAVLHTESGRFVSLTDPPAALRADADACRNDGAWPVLAGVPGDRSTVLASPIILEDHPRVAPESPGDLFDGGEIDQLLTLNIMAMTDEEKAEMRATDPRVREILERAEAMTADDLMGLHGTIRDWQASP